MELDQHFLIDEKILRKIVVLSKVGERDIVLEIGAGRGELTELLAEKVKKVVAVEKDENLFLDLKKLDGNVEPVLGNALDLKFPKFNKIISNIPYSISEALIQKLIYYDFELGIFLVPEKFSKLLVGEKNTKLTLIANIFYDINLYEKIPPEKFSPKPRTYSRIISLEPKKPNFQETIFKQFLRQRDKKVKNALREAIIQGAERFGKKFTKNQAREFTKEFEIDKKVQNLDLRELEKIKKVFWK